MKNKQEHIKKIFDEKENIENHTNRNEIDNSIPFETDTNIAKNNNLQEWETKEKHVPKQVYKLQGGKTIATFNGGQLQPIMYQYINAGDIIHSAKFKKQIRVLAPKVPTTDSLSVTIRACFVPFTFIIDNYDELKANKAEIGRQLNTTLPTVTFDASDTLWGNYTNTYLWKTKVASFYLPNNVSSQTPISIIPVRAYNAMYNNFCRNKDYQPALATFTSNTVTSVEKALIVGSFTSGNPNLTLGYGTIQKDQKKNNYYTNIKRQLQASQVFQGLETDRMIQAGATTITHFNEFYKYYPGGTSNTIDNNNYKQIGHLDWQEQIAEYRRRTNDSIKNDWDIIAELGGTKPVTTDRPLYLGDQTTKLNYQQITQTTPNDNNNQSPLGTTGSYSVTFDSNALFGSHTFLQDGIIIITATVQSDNTYEEAIHRTALITNTTEMFNPEIADIQTDFLLQQEINGSANTTSGQTSTYLAFKPKYTEFTTLPNLCIRDVRSNQLKTTASGSPIASISQWHNFNTNGTTPVTIGNTYFQDQTDLLIARNSLQTTTDYASNDQILLAGELEIEMRGHAIKKITQFGAEKPLN